MAEAAAGARSRSARSERKRAQRMERLEQTAATVFAEKGYDGANFDLIAAKLDLRGPSLYYYFSSKEELFLRCVQRSGEDVFARLRVILETNHDPAERLRALFREQVLIEVRDYPEFVPLFFKTYVPIPQLRDAVLAIRRDHATLFEDAAAQISGAETSRADVRIRLGVAFGALAYLPEWYNPSGEIGVDELAEKLSNLLVTPFLR